MEVTPLSSVPVIPSVRGANAPCSVIAEHTCEAESDDLFTLSFHKASLDHLPYLVSPKVVGQQLLVRVSPQEMLEWRGRVYHPSQGSHFQH